MLVELTLHEQVQVGLAAAIRVVESVATNATPRLKDRPGLWKEINSTGAETATAKFAGRYWSGVNRAAPDVFPDIEVRWTDKPDGRLIVRENDPDERRVVLVRGTFPVFDIVGWIRAGDAKQAKYWEDPNGDGECFMVPAADLNPDFSPRKKPPVAEVAAAQEQTEVATNGK